MYGIPRCLARRRCYISLCSCYYFSLGDLAFGTGSAVQCECGKGLPGARRPC